jgi:hypothetical protein
LGQKGEQERELQTPQVTTSQHLDKAPERCAVSPMPPLNFENLWLRPYLNGELKDCFSYPLVFDLSLQPSSLGRAWVTSLFACLPIYLSVQSAYLTNFPIYPFTHLFICLSTVHFTTCPA